MQIVFMQIEPVFPGDGVADGIAGVRVQDHLRIADGAGGEVDEAGIIAARFWTCIRRRCRCDDALKTGPVGQIVRANQDCVANSRTGSAHLVKFMRPLLVGDDPLGLGDSGAKLQVFRGEKRCRGSAPLPSSSVPARSPTIRGCAGA